MFLMETRVLEYCYFMTLFHDQVEKKIEYPRGRLTCLTKYNKDDPKEMIKYCAQQPTAFGYDNVKELLEKKYRNWYNIISMYRKEIKSWPQLKNDDGSNLLKFYNFLLKCESITESREWNPRDTPDMICILLFKLPRKIRDKWFQALMNKRKKETHKEGTFGDFIM